MDASKKRYDIQMHKGGMYQRRNMTPKYIGAEYIRGGCIRERNKNVLVKED